MQKETITKETIFDLYVNQKKSLKDISLLTGVAVSTIHYMMKKFKIETRTVSQALKGRKVTEIEKQRLVSILKKANKNKTEKQIEACKKNLKNSYLNRLGSKHSVETKRKMSEKAIGRKNTLEAKLKMSKTRKEKYFGSTSYWFGKQRLDLQGDKNPNWNNGITSYYKSIRSLPKYKQWRLSCFQRDSYTCQQCQNTNCVLNVDHIKPFCLIIKEHNISNTSQALVCNDLWNIDNGRTLCIQCHRKTDTFGRKVKNHKK